MMKKQPTATQQKLIDNGAATRTITIRYESTGSWGAPTRHETVKTALPDLGDGHVTFRAGRDTYIIANNSLYLAQTHNLNESHRDRQPGDLRETFYLGTYDDKAEAVSKTYDNTYSNSVIVNGRVAHIIDNVLYAHLLDGRMYAVDDLDTAGDYNGSEYVRVNSQKIGSWRVPLIHADKLRATYREYMHSHGVDGDLAGDETANIPFNDEAVAAALAANAEGVQWGVDTGVYVPTTEEMGAADALNGAFRGVEGGYGEVNSLATARRIADALAAYEEARKGATIL